MDDSGADPRLGRFVETSVAGETVRAFVPPPLPPEPPVHVLSVLGELGAAERALGRLDGITALLPRHELFLYMYVRKEAVLSSQIEGTQSTLSDLLRFEIAVQSLPLSLRLIKEMHGLLLRSGRGATKDPGEFRRSQNWVGGTRPGNALYVPPPPAEMAECLGDLELFMHEEASELPALVKAGLLHVQFETIHPFLDGNGRIGRLLVTLYLCVNGVLRTPLLYLSLYLKVHRSEYYQLLQDVRERGDWERWLKFFLAGVAETANQAFDAANRIVALFRGDRERISAESARASSALRVHNLFQQHPYLTANQLVHRTGLSAPTVNAALADLGRLGIVNEITGRKRGRVFSYGLYLAILSEGTDPLSSGS